MRTYSPQSSSSMGARRRDRGLRLVTSNSEAQPPQSNNSLTITWGRRTHAAATYRTITHFDAP